MVSIATHAKDAANAMEPAPANEIANERVDCLTADKGAGFQSKGTPVIQRSRTRSLVHGSRNRRRVNKLGWQGWGKRKLPATLADNANEMQR